MTMQHAPRPARFLLGLLCTLGLATPAAAQDGEPPSAESVIGTLDIVGDDGEQNLKPLPKIGVQPSLASNIEDVTVHGVVRRDLDLCGEFEVIADKDAPDGLYLSDSPVDVEAWKKKGAEAVVKVTGKKLGNGKIELKGLAFLTDVGDKAVYDETLVVAPEEVRFASHRIADALVGALTGTDSAFYSQMTFIYGVGKQRRVYVMDADGHDPHPVSEPKATALSPVFGPNHEVQYALSRNRRAFKIFREGQNDPLKFEPRGSVYGLAYNRDLSQVAVSIGVGPTIHVYTGPDFFHLKEASKVDMAMSPAWSPTGKLAFSGEGQWGQRIFVEGKPVSPGGLNASHPTFCRHPDGIRLVYMVGWGENADLVAAGETGGGTVRITAGKGKNMYPACSPDGRLVAFFSTRTTGEGPGLYVMRVDGRRPKRISTLVGRSISWARMPKPKK